MQIFRLRRAANRTEPPYSVLPSLGALLSSELSVVVDHHSQPLEGSCNMDMSIRNALEKEDCGLRIRDWGARARIRYPLKEQPTMFFRLSLGHLFRHDTL